MKIEDAYFSKAIVRVLSHEGGGRIADDPEDPGGLTKYGISRRAYPDVDIRNLTRGDAIEIYRADYWEKPGMSRVASVHPDLAVRVFDLGVNCGPVRAIRMLQHAANTVCAGTVPAHRAAKWRREIARLIHGKVLLTDGIIGPQTLGVLLACPYPAALAVALQGEAYLHYKPLNPLYRPGWLSRLASWNR